MRLQSPTSSSQPDSRYQPDSSHHLGTFNHQSEPITKPTPDIIPTLSAFPIPDSCWLGKKQNLPKTRLLRNISSPRISVKCTKIAETNVLVLYPGRAERHSQLFLMSLFASFAFRIPVVYLEVSPKRASKHSKTQHNALQTNLTP